MGCFNDKVDANGNKHLLYSTLIKKKPAEYSMLFKDIKYFNTK